MSIIPEDYSLDAPFQPLDDVDKIIKDDFAPASTGAISTGRVRVGTWVQFTGAGGTLQKPSSETLHAVAPSWSDYDSQGVAGHPDAFRNQLLTVLVGTHRGRTQYYLRDGGQAVLTTSVGAPLTVWDAQAADVAAINASYGGKVISEVGDGLLGLATTTTSPYPAFVLRGPDANDFIEYYKY